MYIIDNVGRALGHLLGKEGSQDMMELLVKPRHCYLAGKVVVMIALSRDATVDHLDSLLRRLWLECCGHLSQLEVGFKKFVMPADLDYDDLDEDDSKELLRDMLPAGQTSNYEYLGMVERFLL